MADQQTIEALAAEVLASPKYRHVSPGLVRDLAVRELAAHRSRKDAAKAVKNKLHQVAGAYFEARPDYDAWLGEIAAAAARPGAEEQGPAAGDHERTAAPPEHTHGLALSTQHSALAVACAEVMRRHASTRERLPILGRFYAEVFAALPPVRSVLDLASGLNPLALPWMPLAPGATYHACDLYADMAAFLEGFFQLAEVDGRAEVCDLIQGPPSAAADLALALKLLPVLEQVDRAAPLRLLRAVQAPYILVSFPAQSLGGRGKGMAENYERRFRDLVGGEGWDVTMLSFPSELAFLVDKRGAVAGEP
ncbi:MAG: hypothetical protein RLZZ387_4424 [Chloroflexota bacterium]|jgi:16S rRNA (guanine(1405)-N(7))-methyltransferase